MNEDSPTTTRPPFLERRPVEGACPRCGARDLRAYPVNSEGGWFDVVRCQSRLLSVDRTRGPRLGTIRLLSDLL